MWKFIQEVPNIVEKGKKGKEREIERERERERLKCGGMEEKIGDIKIKNRVVVF